MGRSYFENFLFLPLPKSVDLRHDQVGVLLKAFLPPARLVLGDFLIPLVLLDLLLGVATAVAHRDATVLDSPVQHLHQLFSSLLGQGWNCQADDLAVVCWGDSQVGLE